VINQPRDWSTDNSDEAKEIEAAVGISGPAFTNLTDGRCLCGLCVLETITNVAKALEDAPRQQKALLFIGADITVHTGPQTTGAGVGSSLGEMDCSQKLTDARALMNAALDRSGVIVHSLDPSGLQQTGPTGRASSTLRGVDVRSSFSSAVDQSLQRLGNLQILPARTGGRVVVNTNDPDEHVPAIIRESASYYLLGYRPAEPQIPGQTRKIEVKVRRRDVTVSARRQFVVPTAAATTAVVATTSAELGSALRAAVPAAEIPLSIAASSFAPAGGPTAAVAVALDVSSVADQGVAPGGTRAALEIAVASYDMRGRPEGAVEVVSVTDLPPRHGRRLEALARLDLPPGDHELRATVVAPDTGRVASVFTHVTIPPFGKNPLTLSHIAMTAPADTDTIRRERVSGLLPIVPTTARVFPRTAPVSAFMQVYQGLDRKDAVQPVAITATVIDRAGVTRVREVLPLTVEAFGDRRTADCRVTLPVSRLEPGEYLLTLEAATAAHAAGRAIRFSVE
jgi:VWFA-related protein